MNRTFAFCNLQESYVLECGYRAKAGMEDATVRLPVHLYLPHELFANLYHCDKSLWEATFGTDAMRITGH